MAREMYMVRTSLLLIFAIIAGCGQKSGDEGHVDSESKTVASDAAPSRDSQDNGATSSKNLFFVGKWATEAANCGDASWTITESELQTPGEVTCQFHDVTGTERGTDVNATCWAEGPPREWTLHFAYAESARALLIENAPFDDIGLIRCDDAPVPDEEASPAAYPANEEARVAKRPSDAAKVLSRYYELANAGRFEEASELWTASERTRALKSLETSGEYPSRDVRIGAPGRVEGAAGSLYVTIPIQIYAEANAGENRRWDGEATLRRSNDVPGATPEQREWRIVRIDLEPTTG